MHHHHHHCSDLLRRMSVGCRGRSVWRSGPGPSLSPGSLPSVERPLRSFCHINNNTRSNVSQWCISYMTLSMSMRSVDNWSNSFVRDIMKYCTQRKIATAAVVYCYKVKIFVFLSLCGRFAVEIPYCTFVMRHYIFCYPCHSMQIIHILLDKFLFLISRLNNEWIHQ